MSYQEQTTIDQTIAPVRDEKLATKDIFDTLAADSELSKFTELIRKAGLEGRLRGPDLVTVLAPLNEAFDGAALDGGGLSDELARDYILRGAATGAELGSSRSVKTLNNRALEVRKENGDVRIGQARLVRTDIECTNGVVHVVESLLRP